MVSNFELSVILSSSSDPSTLSKALATGDFGEVGLIRFAARLVELACPADFPETKQGCV